MTAATAIDINTATRDELLAYAKDELGLNPKGNISKEALAQLVGDQLGQSSSEESGLAVEISPEAKRTGNELRKCKKVKIRIHENEKHPARIPVSINGYDFSIKPGAVVEVPEPVVDVLRNAVQTTYHQESDEQGRIRTVPRQSLQFPFEIVA